MQKRLFPMLAMVILCLSLLFVTASAEEAPVSVSNETVVTYSIEPAIQLELPTDLYSLEDGTVMIEGSTAVQWIDRMAIGSDDSDPIRKFYNTLVEYTDNDGQNDYFIQPCPTDTIEIVTVTGTLTASSEADAKSQLAALTNEVSSQYKSFISAAYSAFDRDHPEVFWLNGQLLIGKGYGYTGFYNSTNGIAYTITISVLTQDSTYNIQYSTNYSSADAIKAAIADLNSAVNTINAGLPAGASTYEMLRYYNEWLTEHNEYCTKKPYADYTRNPLTALQGHAGAEGPVCEGYARAFKVLCDEANIPCVLVDGDAKNTPSGSGEAHMWNYVQLDGSWYAVDVTWNDPVVSDKSGAVSGYESENYFLVGGSTVVDSMAFLTSHPVSNRPSSATIFPDGPALSADKYDPTAVEPDCQLSATLDNNGSLTMQLKNFSSGTVCFAAYSIDGKLLEIYVLPNSASSASKTFVTQALKANEKPSASNAGKIAFAKAFVWDSNSIPLHTIEAQILGDRS